MTSTERMLWLTVTAAAVLLVVGVMVGCDSGYGIATNVPTGGRQSAVVEVSR